MAKTGNVNNTVSFGLPGAATLYFADKQCAKVAGWTIPSSSDGLTYNSSGDQISSAASGAGGMQNTGSWFRKQEPGGLGEWCVQFGNNTTNQARIKYSAAAKFVGGSPGATRVPSAADEQVLIGGGTDASPTYGQVFTLAAGLRYHIIYESTPVGTKYGFIMFCTAIGGVTQVAGIMMQEPMAPGSYVLGADLDPVVVLAANVTTIATVSGWMGFGSPGQVWSAQGIAGNNGIFNGSLGVDVGSGNPINGFPVYSATVSGTNRPKGYGALQSAKGPALGYPATTNGTGPSADEKVYLSSYVYMYLNGIAPQFT